MKMPHEEPPISPVRAASVAIMTKVACYPDVHEEAKVRANGKEQTVSNVKTNQKKSKKAKDKNKKTSSRPDCVIIPPVNQECSVQFQQWLVRYTLRICWLLQSRGSSTQRAQNKESEITLETQKSRPKIVFAIARTIRVGCITVAAWGAWYFREKQW